MKTPDIPPATTAREAEQRVPFHALWPFLLITFAIAWGILGFYVFLPDTAAGLFGQLTGTHPLFFLCVWAPGIAGVLVVLWTTGPRGLRQFSRRLLLWRTSPGWWAFLLLGIPLLFFVGAIVKNQRLVGFAPVESVPALLTVFLFTALKGPVEELGWRGVALPLLQRKMAPLWAALIIGIIWGIWHMPAFLLSGTPQSGWSFPAFFAGNIALSLLITALFNDSRGSILLCAFFHFQTNNPLWPDAQPHDTAAFVAAALIVVLIRRKMMLKRSDALTAVVPDSLRKSA